MKKMRFEKLDFLLSRLFVISAVLLFSCTEKVSGINIYCVDSVKLFQEFEYQKNYTNIVKTNAQFAESKLDSLRMGIEEVLSGEDVSESETVELKNFYFQENKKFENYFEQQKQELNENVDSQINKYLNEYSKDNNISVLLGANGNGSILYMDSTVDVTNDLIQFCNKNYKKDSANLDLPIKL